MKDQLVLPELEVLRGLELAIESEQIRPIEPPIDEPQPNEFIVLQEDMT